MTMYRAPHALLLLAGLTMSSAALAQDAAPPAAPLSGAVAIDDAALGAIAGREDHAQLAFANQTAGVSTSSVGDNVATGEARVSDQAFQNVSGLSIVNINTGNNVAINAAMNVNITITPAP